MEVEIKSTKFVLTSNSGALPGVADPSGDDPNPDPTLEKKKTDSDPTVMENNIVYFSFAKKRIVFWGGRRGHLYKIFQWWFSGQKSI